MLRALLLSLVLGVLAPALARAQAAHAPHVQVRLISDTASIAPGQHFKVALVQTIEQGWHTYWRNPGDSGDATKIRWRLPGGFSAGEIQWPVPERMPVAFLMNYGYAGEAVLPVTMTAPARLQAGGTVTLSADASWLVCADICVPEQATVTLALRTEAQAQSDADGAARIAHVQFPRTFDGEAHISAGAPATLSAALDVGEDARNFYFFPYERRAIDHAAPQAARLGAAGVSLTLKEGAAHDLGAVPLNGVLTFDQRDASGAWARQAYELHATPGAMIDGTTDVPAPGAELVLGGTASSPSPSPQAMSIWAALALALLGGLILNIMPCVLPVLSIKALSFVGGDPAKLRRQGVLYLAGVIVSFLVLAALLLGLRSMGAAVGWGFQLQTPWVSAALALLFFVIGLNLLSVFEIGGGVQSAGQSLTRGDGSLATFSTGVLAVVAATPCTAPFMAGALGTALTQPPAIALMIFLALAVGFALPLTALCFLPALRRWLPKPGAWMQRAKVVLAFPMFATAAWLVSVLSAETGAGGVIGVLMFAAAIAFALVVGRWGRIWIVAGATAIVVAGVFAIPALATPRASASAAQNAETWTPARVAQLRGQGRPVFVNFTAAWCVTCQVNELGVLRSPRVVNAFHDRGVTYLEADWTNPNPDIAAELTAHNRAGVPLYLYYPPGNGPPVVLPQVLSEQTVLNAISGAR